MKSVEEISRGVPPGAPSSESPGTHTSRNFGPDFPGGEQDSSSGISPGGQLGERREASHRKGKDQNGKTPGKWQPGKGQPSQWWLSGTDLGLADVRLWGFRV